MKKYTVFLLLLVLFSCENKKAGKGIPVIGFMDAFEDETLAQAKQGFFDALAENGFSEDKKTIHVLYRNAQGDIPTLTQICDYFVSEKVNLLATNTTISTITAVQKTKEIPICMMVAPSPELAGLLDASGKAPSNLFGVFETLHYIDTSVALIKEVCPSVKKLGLIYNQAEPQSLSAFSHLQQQCKASGIEVFAQSVSNSSETQLVVQSLLSKNIDAFFALPDNSVFASFETIAKSCADAKIPVFTSESGLVARGALAAYGADMYLWGYQAGKQAVNYLSNPSGKLPTSELVKIRKKIIHKKVAETLGIKVDQSFSVY